MARKKVALKYIVNDRRRKASTKKRTRGLIKKIDELTTLCGVDACAIIYIPNESQPKVWPSSLEVEKVVSKFAQMPEVEQSKKMHSQETYLEQKVLKTREQVRKLNMKNRKKEMTHLMTQCLSGAKALLNDVAFVDLNDLTWVINQKINEITARIGKLDVQEGASNGGQENVEAKDNQGV